MLYLKKYNNGMGVDIVQDDVIHRLLPGSVVTITNEFSTFRDYREAAMNCDNAEAIDAVFMINKLMEVLYELRHEIMENYKG